MVKKSTQEANQTRAQVSKSVYEKAMKQRAESQQLLAAEYRRASEEGDPILLDIQKKLKGFVEYHTKMARDGVGVKKTGHVLQNGESEMETVFYTNNKRVSELDKSAGLLELSDYIDRQINPPEVSK